MTDEALRRFGLQLFAGDGGAAGGADGGAAGTNAGATAADAGQQTTAQGASKADQLAALGVPEGKIRAKYRAEKATAQAVEQPAAEAEAQKAEPAAEKRMTWDEIMADPEYNSKMQETVQARLKSAKSAESDLAALQDSLALLAKRYGVDSTDTAALAQAITGDKSYYEDKALELGIPVETAMKLEQLEQEKAKKDAAEQQQARTQQLQKHFSGLQSQAAELKKQFPGFDLMAEIQGNRDFAKWTSPDFGMSVEAAYWASHYSELVPASMQVAVEKTTQQMANAIASGTARVRENGSSSQAASTGTIGQDLSKAGRESIKQKMQEAKRQGKKLYADGTIR